MKLSKTQMLDLVKVLSHYEVVTDGNTVADLSDLREDLESELVDGTEEEDEEDEDEYEDDEDSSSEEDEEEAEEGDEEEEDDDDGDEEEDEDEGKEDLVSDTYVYGSDLHDLSPCKATDEDGEEATLEFESTDEATNLLVSGNGDDVLGVRFIRRTGTELHVGAGEDNLEWTVYQVKKYPKGWATTLPAGDLCEVES